MSCQRNYPTRSTLPARPEPRFGKGSQRASSVFGEAMTWRCSTPLTKNSARLLLALWPNIPTSPSRFQFRSTTGPGMLRFRSMHTGPTLRPSIHQSSNMSAMVRTWSAPHGPTRSSSHITPHLLLGLPVSRVQRSGPVTAEVGGSSPPRPTTILNSVKPQHRVDVVFALHCANEPRESQTCVPGKRIARM